MTEFRPLLSIHSSALLRITLLYVCLESVRVVWSACVCRGIIASLGGRNTQRTRALLEALTHVSSVLATSSRLYLTRGRCVCVCVSVCDCNQKCLIRVCVSAASPLSQRSGTPCSDPTATPPCSPQHILNWQSG